MFLSPAADGPIKFNTNPDGTQNIMNLSRFGRSFSILRVPYSFKLLMQELQVMNVQMRIITEDNVDQLLSMSYSDNINKLMKSTKSTAEVISDYSIDIRNRIQAEQKIVKKFIPIENPETPEPANIETTSVSPEYAAVSPEYDPNSPAYAPPTPTQYSPTGYVPNSPEYNPQSPTEYNPSSNEEQAMATATEVPVSLPIPVPVPGPVPGPAPSILEVKPEPTVTESEPSEGSAPQTVEEKALIIESSSSTTPETSSGVKKITI